MVMTIELKPEVEAGLRQRAQDAGCDTSGYVQRLIARDLAGPVNIRDLFAPVREQIRASQVTDEELDALLEEAREEAFQARPKKAGALHCQP